MASRKTCKAKRKDGKPCRGPAIRGDYCVVHSPELAEKVKAGRYLGGINKSKARRVQKLVPIGRRYMLDQIESAMADAHAGAMDLQQAKSIDCLTRSWISIYKVSELELRLMDLEKKYRLEERNELGPEVDED